ncbi:MAG: diguanylate cyclase, partial [Burkholderiales bacterium]
MNMSLTANILRFVLSLKIVLAAFIASALAFAYYVSARDDVRAANEARYESLLLMQELRQSSDDLTRMVRSYVVTGEARYRNQFDEIIGIRDGLVPRPLEYEEVYWDLVLDDRRPSAAGDASALLQRMETSGFTDEEMNRLAAAKQNSDLLVNIEREAMALVGAGVVAPEQRQQAVRMLFDARYHRAKADIMRPLAEASRLVRARNAEMLADAEGHAFRALLLFALSGAVLVFTLGWTYRNLRLVLGGSVEQLSAAVAAAGDLGAPGAIVKEIGD